VSRRKTLDNGMNLQVALKARTFFEAEELVAYPNRYFSKQ